MPRFDWRIARNVLLVCCLLIMPGAGDPPRPGKVLDEARQAGRSAASLPAPVEDYFHDMDGGVALKPDRATKLDPVLGRNTWLVWSGGNDRFWDKMTSYTFGAFDLLKIVAYDPNKPIDRAERWKRARADQRAMHGRADRARSESLRPDVRCAQGRIAPPIRSRTRRRYPGVTVGARGKHRAGRFAVRLCQRHRRSAAVPQSGLRRRGQGEVGCRRSTSRAI